MLDEGHSEIYLYPAGLVRFSPELRVSGSKAGCLHHPRALVRLKPLELSDSWSNLTAGYPSQIHPESVAESSRIRTMMANRRLLRKRLSLSLAIRFLSSPTCPKSDAEWSGARTMITGRLRRYLKFPRLIIGGTMLWKLAHGDYGVPGDSYGYLENLEMAFQQST
ncbi:hypothetical protein BJX63DRAFT_117819 [Aspergillus granulosus]|uniref:Uncharacterized protein n=1 Tax=Aspergillus granulosus TaxID=176169 RepID=A0ABR4HPT5_9EURO